jgi:O-antigen/teichoic acid export membrane protein
MQISTYAITPIMIGLIVVARPLVLVLLTEKWLPCVVYLQIGCVANLFRCQQFINNSVIKASGKVGLLLKLDILKKSIGLILLLVSMKFGVLWIAWSQVAIYFISMVINIAPNQRILNYGYWNQFKDVCLSMIPAFIMGACVYPISFLHMNETIQLILQIVMGVGVFVGISILTKNKNYYYVLGYVRNKLPTHEH